YTGANLGTSYAANTVTTEPGSTLTVKSGIIENLTYDSGIIAYAIDGRTNGGIGDVAVSIEGGQISSLRQSIRIFANSTTKTGTLKISAGEITGRVIVQNANANANKAELEITGGTFNKNEYKDEVLYVGGSNGATIDMTPVVSGGIFNGEIESTLANNKYITGGTFKTDVTKFLADGCEINENENGTYGIVPAKGSVAAIGNVGYTSLAKAITAAEDGDTVTLLKSVELDATLNITKAITLDLKNNILTSSAKCAVQVSGGNNDLEVKIINGKIVGAEGSGDNGTSALSVYDGADVTVENVALSGTYYGIKIGGYDDYPANVNDNNLTSLFLKGTTSVTADNAAIIGLGAYPNTLMEINEGVSVTSTDSIAIYHPQYGILNVKGGTITGTTGIYMKAGNLNVTGGTITGNGEKAEYEYNSSGAASTGDGIVVESCNYGGYPTPEASIEGGTISSVKANAVAAYKSDDAEAVDNFISGGTYSDNSAEAYLAEGYVLESYEDADGNTVYGVEPTYTVTITIPEGAAIVVKDADGKEVEANEDKTYTLVDGTYTYTVTKDGYKAATKEFTVEGEALELTVTLEENSAPAPNPPATPEIFPEKVFEDVKVDDWFYGDVKFCMENGLMKGMSDTAFEPDTIATRGMIVTMLYRLEGEPAVSEGAEIKFTDLEEDEWYTDAVIWAAQNEILFGYTDGTCRPNEQITREQMACFLYRYADMKEAVPAGDHGLVEAFPADGDTVSEWAVDAMSWATGTELIKGYGDGVLAPQDFAKRSQVAAVFQRLCNGPLAE
ncbi:MAG: S-layer homology domain-containing protein, partial [Firmicutes bacterium]|nr:S-layer homology domain-containing protein [Bacillota bacterium]